MSNPTSAYPMIYKKKSKPRTGQIILGIVMLLFVLVCTLPFINVIAISLSSKSAILRGDVSFLPVEFSTKAYEADGEGGKLSVTLSGEKFGVNCVDSA